MKRAAISPNAVARKLDSNLGSENQGKVLGVDSTGAVVPVEMSSGAKLYIVSGTITNTSGSYTTTINNEFITAEMKAVEIELGTPSIFGDKITVTCGAGFVTISCPSVSGTSTYKISLIKSIDDPTAVTSTEFDILSNRIGTLSNLHTTDKTTIVAAVNENTDAIAKLDTAESITDFNSAIATGIYKASPGTTNQPYNDYNVLYVYAYNAQGNDVGQLVISINNRRMFFRTRKDGTTWMSWQELVTKTDISSFNISGTSLSSIETQLVTLCSSMPIGSVQTGILYGNYSQSMTGGAKCIAAASRVDSAVYKVSVFGTWKEGYYYSNAWHWI